MNRPDNMKSKGKAMRNGAKAKPTKDDIYEEEYDLKDKLDHLLIRITFGCTKFDTNKNWFGASSMLLGPEGHQAVPGHPHMIWYSYYYYISIEEKIVY